MIIVFFYNPTDKETKEKLRLADELIEKLGQKNGFFPFGKVLAGI